MLTDRGRRLGDDVLHIHRAERSDRLVAALGEVLAEPPADPLATELVAVHSRGIERFIAQELSGRLGTGPLGGDGVCANVEFPFPGRLIRAAVAAGSGIDPDHDPWLPERLTWPLLALVDEHAGHPMLGPLRAHLGGGHATPDPERLTRRFGAVRHIADLFDRYGVHRPEMVLGWRAGQYVGPDGGPLPERHRWQPALWRAVRDRIDLDSFAERRAAAITALHDDPDVLDLPRRFALFGLTALPATYLEVLTAIAAHREVHLLLLHPSPVLWDRVAEHVAEHVEDGEGRPGPSAELPTRDDDPTRQLPDNPLLRSWGRDARELQLTTPVPADAAQHHHAAPPPEGRTLLERIQADVHADRVPGAAGERPLLRSDDRSLQVHDCHGRLRQVEVLRDAILHLLQADPTLEPRDIIVMCPDIETFAPLVTAVFGADAVVDDRDGDGDADRADAPPALRVRLADRSLRRTNPVLEVVSLLLELVDGRVTASAVLDLLSREPVRRRFRFDEDDVELLAGWVGDLQIRWGIDAGHRRRNGLPELDANTWRAGLERLQLGIAMADEDLRLVEGVAPFDGVEGRDNDLAGRLVELVERLDEARRSMTGARPVDGWRDAIGAAADALTATDGDHDWQRLQLHRVLQELVDEATRPDGSVTPVELTLHEVGTLLSQRLAGRPSTTSHRTGDLTVCTLVPMRSVPHRVVCLLGLDDGSFPRQAAPDSDDLLQLTPRVGDRDPRAEDRQLLLDALLAATETVVITYAGRDERTNEDRPAAVPVDELLDVVDRTVRTGDDRRPRQVVTVRHPLQAYDPRNFEPGVLRRDGGVWGFHPPALAAAAATRGERRDPPAFLATPLPLPDEEVIDLDDLVSFLQHPVRAFVRQRLEVSLPGEGDELSDAIPATLGGLDAWKVGDELLRAWLDGDDLDRAVEVVRARGLLPPGDVGSEDVTRVHEQVRRITELCLRRGIEPGPRGAVDVEVELPDGRLLAGTVPDVCGRRIDAVGYSRVGPKHRLAAWARFLALTAQEPDGGWCAATAGRHPWRKRGASQVVQLEFDREAARDPAAAATAHLLRLVDLYDRGRREPLPLYCKASAKSAEQRRKDADPMLHVDKEWESNPWVGFDAEDRDPYHLLVLGRQAPTDDLFAELCHDAEERSWADDDRRFVAYAWRLWEPILDTERRCDG